MMRLFLSIYLFLLSSVAATAQSNNSPAWLTTDVDALFAKTVSWRRQLHQNPELSNRETNTAKLIAAHLKSLGLQVQEGVAHTGVVGILKGGKPGPVIGLRADMDALPVTEETDLPFASKATATYNGQQVGVMHACGHDTHVAMLMSAAEILSKRKAEVAGTVKFIFQPAEEGPPAGEEGGALLMIKEGVMDNPKVDVMFGLHINAQTPVGQIRYRARGMMAAADWFTITIKGKQVHGAQPWLGVDPVVVGAQVINGLQTIVSRQMELTKNAVVISTTIFKGGVRENIIPEQAQLAGTIRTLDTAMRTDVKRRIQTMATNIAEASGATATVSFEPKTAIVYNDPPLLQKMMPSLQKATGGNLVEMDAATGAEDYSFFAEKVPSLFLYVGGRPLNTTEQQSAPHHTPKFFVDEEGMKTGIRAFCQLVLDYPKVAK
ncbi:amidohydrolase [Paracnuella aquatica]|uniref:amidohydrolase n=1 Tax=Paracnuella aquatica TaxID=2268757 RepID=UPI0019D457A9|nr:amidohydrolase [Paracnuella aquatica]